MTIGPRKFTGLVSGISAIIIVICQVVHTV